MVNKFYRQYMLLRDTLDTVEGQLVTWDVWRNIYTSKPMVSGFDDSEETFAKDRVENRDDWFEPIGTPVPFYDKYPDDINDHFYFGELRHNQMCRFCTEAQSILESDEFKDEVSGVLKRLYEKKLAQDDEIK